MQQEEEGACSAVAGDDVKNKNMNKNKSKRVTMLKNILQRRRQQQASSNDNDNDNDNDHDNGEYKPMGGQGGVQYAAGVLDDNETADRIRNQCSLFYNGADEEEQQYNTAYTQIDTMRTSNVQRQKAHSTGSSIYDAENPAARSKSGVFDPITINSEDFSVSTLFRKDNDGKCQYRLPTDHVRLSVIPNVEPGILSMVVGGDDRRESIKSTATTATGASGVSESLNDASIVRVPNKLGKSNETENSWDSVSYVLSIDEHLYRRVVQEMADSMQSPYGCYNCCRDTSDSGRVSIQIAIFILAVFFFFLFITTLVFPTT